MKPQTQPTAGGHTVELQSQITELNAQLREMEENRVLIVGQNDALRSQNEALVAALQAAHNRLIEEFGYGYQHSKQIIAALALARGRG